MMARLRNSRAGSWLRHWGSGRLTANIYRSSDRRGWDVRLFVDGVGQDPLTFDYLRDVRAALGWLDVPGHYDPNYSGAENLRTASRRTTA